MKKLLFLLICATWCTHISGRRSDMLSGYIQPIAPGPQAVVTPNNIATAQFQTNVSYLELNTKGTYTISKSGIYYLSGDVHFKPLQNTASTSMFHVTTSYVTIDLNNSVITQADTNNTLGLTAIIIDDYCKNVTIRNGTLSEMSAFGILIGKGCENIVINEMTITNCVQGGIILNGTSDFPVKTAVINNVYVTRNHGDPTDYGDTDSQYDALGIHATYVENLAISHCACNNNQTTKADQNGYGILLQHCTSGSLNTVSLHLNKAPHNTYGLCLQQCSTVEMYNIKSNENTSTQQKACGISLQGCNDCRIYKSETQSNQGHTTTAGIEITGITDTTYFPSNYNSCIECESISNKATTSHAYGYVSAGNTGNAFINCLAQGNTSGSTGSTYAAGFYVTHLVDENTVDHPDENITLDSCYAKANIASNGTGVGILLDTVTTACIDNCWLLNNKGTTTSYGILDLSSPTTSLIMNNFAFGQTINYAVTHDASNESIPLSSGSIGDFRPFNSSAPFHNIEWQEPVNESAYQ